MLCRRRLTRPMRPAIAGRKHYAGFAKDPSVRRARKYHAHKTRVDIGHVKVNWSPGQSAVVCAQQIRTRFVIRLQLVNIAFSDEPARMIVDEANVAESVFGERRNSLPSRAAIVCFQQRAAAAGYPTAILIEKLNAVQPR